MSASRLVFAPLAAFSSSTWHHYAAAFCVLLDVSMPGENGGQIGSRISAGHPQLPVIFMSGYEAQSVPMADGFLHKPFTLNELRSVLRAVRNAK